MTTPDDDWSPPPGLDTSKPTPARMYDYYLGGKDNFPADREAARRVIEALPDVPLGVRENRAFLVRAVDYLADQCGIDQFIDIGTGIPTSPNVHEVVRSRIPDARVVYVDNDPIVTAHNRALRETMDGVVGVEGDLRQLEVVFDHPDFRRTIDLSRPAAVLCFAVFQFIPAEHDARIRDYLLDQLAHGSWWAISMLSGDRKSDQEVEQLLEPYKNSTAPATLRCRHQLETLIAGWKLVDPGIVPVSEWRPDIDTPTDTNWLYVALAHKP